ncbi:MAG: OmpA family protein [Pseudomonadota bacterium]
MRLSTIVPLVAAFGGAAMGAYVAAGIAVSALETNSAREVDFQMKLQGHDWAEVVSDGLQVVLSGEAPTEADRFKALSVAGGVVDTARVIDNMSVYEEEVITAPHFSLEMLRNDAGISLIGLIPAATDREGIIRRLTRAAGSSSITDLVETADYPTPDGWVAAVDYGIAAMAQLPRSKISVAADRVQITATAESNEERARLQAELSRAAPDGIRAALSISAPRPVITPFTLRFLIDADGARFDACAADTEAAMDLVLAAAAEAGIEGKSECRLGLGAPSPDWGTAAAESVAAIGALGGGTVTLSDLDISLVAAMGSDPAVFEDVTDRLETSLPDAFTLTAVLPEPEVETEEGPPEFTATLSPEGQVQMRGHLGDDLALAAVETYAKSRFGAQMAALSSESHSALPKGWSLRVLAGLAALAELERGSVEVASDGLDVRGTTGNLEGRARIAQVLSEELGEGQAFSINVAYDERLDPTANIPTPEECLADIGRLTDAKKLTFEPGSADLDADSLETITAIADVMKGCPEFEIVIEGHTDSQGREVMNLALSQERAEAVVEALRGERVVWSGLFPQGFGEATPIADNGTEEGREANRRIEFKFFSAVEEDAADAGQDDPDYDADAAEDAVEDATGE